MAVIGSSQPASRSTLDGRRRTGDHPHPPGTGTTRSKARRRRDAVPFLWALVTMQAGLRSGGSCLAALFLRLLLAGEREPAGVTGLWVQRMGVPGLVLDAAPRSERALCASSVDGGRGGTPDLSTPRRPSRRVLCICFARSRWPVAMHCAHCTARTGPVECATPDPALSGLDALQPLSPAAHGEEPAPSAQQQRQRQHSTAETSDGRLHPSAPACTNSRTQRSALQACGARAAPPDRPLTSRRRRRIDEATGNWWSERTVD